MPSGSYESRNRRHRRRRNRARLQRLNEQFRKNGLPSCPTLTQAEKQRPQLREVLKNGRGEEDQTE